MTICAVIGCSNRSDKNVNKVSFFAIPSVIRNQCQKTLELSTRRRVEWLAAIKRQDLTLQDEKKIKNSSVCSLHFLKGRPAKLFESTNPDWVPTLSLGYQKTQLDKIDASVARCSRVKVRSEKKADFETAEALLMLSQDLHVDGTAHQINTQMRVDVNCQTDLTMKDICRAQNDCLRMNSELYRLRKEAQNYDEAFFEDDDTKVVFYTGITNFTLLMTVFRFVTAKMESYSTSNKLSLFQEFIIVLMKLKLSLNVLDLAFRFRVSASTISRIFEKWIEILYVRLDKLIIWPEREQLQKTMPHDFKLSFGKRVAVILDCFEIFIDRPSALDTRAETWSQYKHHNTIKFLIGITPQGVISFISLGWGGRTSDKYVTENCGILKNLLPNDLVLADRGFDIADSCGLYCAELAIPAFTRGKSQLSAKEVQDTRKIANLRIHVERVIGLARNKYHILQSCLPILYLKKQFADGLTTADKIVRICCALTNLSNPIVPFA